MDVDYQQQRRRVSHVSQLAHDLGSVRLQKRTLAEPIEQLTFAIDQNPSGPAA